MGTEPTGYDNGELRVGSPDRLMEQAVNWAAAATPGGGNSAPTNINLSAGSVPENLPANTAVGTLSAADPNAGDTHAFALVGGTGSTDNGRFNISGNVLRTGAAFNYESQASFSIRVRATDQGALAFEKVFTIAVSNVNEAPTDIALAPASVPENQAAGTTVGTLTSADPDAGNTFAYTLVAGTGSSGNAAFTIAGGTLKTAAVFDYEAQTSYSIRVRTTDQGGQTLEKVFAVSVTDVTEGGGGGNTPPTLSGVPVSVNVNEGDPVAFTAAAFDPDPGQTLTFSLDGPPAGAGIDPTTGAFTWTPTEAQGPDVFVFNVQVSDAVAVTARTVYAIVREVNTAPALAGVPTAATAVRGDALAFTATAADPDVVAGLPNARFFSLVNPPAGAAIDPDTGEFTWAPGAANPVGTYSIKVRVTDDGVPARYDMKTTAVTLAPAALLDGDLKVGGTGGNDTIKVNPTAGDPSRVTVVSNGTPLGSFLLSAITGRIVVHGLDGADKVTVASQVVKGADLYGDAGNDALTGGSADDRLWGGDGDDKLTGGAGNDLAVGGAGKDVLSGGNGLDVLVGGAGADNLSGGAGDDLLVSGFTSFDADPTALADVVREWNTATDYTTKVGHLTGGTAGGQNGPTVLTAATVFNDTVKDTLSGSAGRDWYVLSVPDAAAGVAADEVKTVIA